MAKQPSVLVPVHPPDSRLTPRHLSSADRSTYIIRRRYPISWPLPPPRIPESEQALPERSSPWAETRSLEPAPAHSSLSTPVSRSTRRDLPAPSKPVWLGLGQSRQPPFRATPNVIIRCSA